MRGFMSLAPPSGVLLGTRQKLSKLRSVENLQRVAGCGELKAMELRHVKSDSR